MKKIILISIFSLIFCNNVFSAEKFDGYYWEKMDHYGKHMYLYGYIQGVSKCGAISTDYFFLEKKTGFLSQIDKESFFIYEREIQGYADSYMHMVLGKSDIKQIISRMDSFYSDYRNKTILARTAFTIIASELVGQKKDVIERGIEFSRKNPEPTLY